MATTITKLNSVGPWLGKPVQTAVFFIGGGSGGWTQVEGPGWLLRDNCQAWLKSGPGKQVSLQLAMMPSGMGLTLAQAASGSFDSHWKTLANNLATYGLLGIELRPAHEMDGGWYPWGVKGKPELNATFAAAFRRMVTVMRAAQPTNKWTIVWNPTADNWPLANSLAYLESIWPGDAYVDQIGADFYDKSFDTGKVYYPSGSDRLTRQKEVWAKLAVRLAIMREFAQKHGKPLQFPEWGLVQYDSTGNLAGWGGGDNPYFIEQMHKFVTDPANNVAMHSYFDVRATTGDDHRISPPSSVFTQASAKFKQLFGAGSD
jgi:Glycosyl hydrolase family 26